MGLLIPCNFFNTPPTRSPSPETRFPHPRLLPYTSPPPSLAPAIGPDDLPDLILLLSPSDPDASLLLRPSDSDVSSTSSSSPATTSAPSSVQVDPDPPPPPSRSIPTPPHPSRLTSFLHHTRSTSLTPLPLSDVPRPTSNPAPPRANLDPRLLLPQIRLLYDLLLLASSR